MIATSIPSGAPGTFHSGGTASSDLVERLRHLVRQSGRRWKTLIVLETASLVISAPLAYLWLVFFLDNLLHLPQLGRLLASVLFFGGAAWLAVKMINRWKTLRLSEDEVALAMEKHTPGGVQNRLINAVQIFRDERGVHSDLSDAVVEENYERLQQIHLRQAARMKPAVLRLGVAGALIGIGVLFGVLMPDHFTNAATRIFLPFANVDPLYRTRLSVEPGDVETTGDVAIRITITGERPKSLTIIKNDDGKRSSEVVPVDKDDGVVTYSFRGLDRSLSYAVHGGDFTTPYFRITLRTPAGLSLVRATYRNPEYTGLPEKTVETAGGDLEALQGTRANITFVFDQPTDEAAILLERAPSEKAGARPATERIALKRVSATRFQHTLVFHDLAGYRLETRQGSRPPQQSQPFALRVLLDQEPKLELTGLDQRAEVQLESVLALKIKAADDYGLERVGLYVRKAGAASAEPENAAAWQEIKAWNPERKTTLRQTHELAVAALNVGEGDKLEVALRAVDTDPLKNGRWTTGTAYRLLVGGEGVALQVQYEQIVRTEAEIKTLIADQRQVMGKISDWIRKLDAAGAKPDVEVLHTAVKGFGADQEKVRQSASGIARTMVAQAGNLRLSVAMLADTEMIRAIRVLDSVPSHDQMQAKRATLSEARLTQERTVRSLQEIGEQYETFRSDWELAHMIPFVRMLADRQARLRDQSRAQAEKPTRTGADIQRSSAARRQAKLLELCALIQPAFKRLMERLNVSEPIIAKAFGSGALTLASETLKASMQTAREDVSAGRWAEAVKSQSAAAEALAALHDRLRKAEIEAARDALEALKAKAKSDLEAQKALEKLKAGSSDTFTRDFPEKLKVTDIIRLREIADAKKQGEGETGKMLDKGLFGEVDAKKIELKEDSGVRQDTDTLQLGDSRPKSIKFPNAVDTEKNKVKPFVQEEFEDLVGKLLDEADELDKDYQTLTLSTNQNNNDPGEVSKQAGRLNSTGAVAATGNKKPPTSNHGGVSRTGRQGARAYGKVLGDEGVDRRGRDKPQEGYEKIGDQAGTIKLNKSDDMQKEASTGVGGKKVESDDTHFSIADAGKWTDDMAKRMDKPQKKNSIVERQGAKLDPRVAAMLRDLTSKQEQVIERIKAIKKELKNLYLPTDHLDEAMKELTANMERLRERPDADLFRLQMKALDRLRGTVKVFRAASSGFQPSMPREQVIRGRVLDEPSRLVLPGYEDAVKRYYEKVAGK